MERWTFDDLPFRDTVNDLDQAILSGADFDNRLAIAQLLGKERRQIRDAVGSGILKRTASGYAPDDIAAPARFVPRRQCILSGLQDNLGQSAFLEADGFNVSLLASKVAPFVASLAKGFDASGMPLDYLVSFDSSQVAAWTVAQGTSYLLISRDASGAISFDVATQQPRYEDKRKPNQYSTTNAFTGGTAFASSSDASFPPNQPFDGGAIADSASTVWRSSGSSDGQWLAYDFGEGSAKAIRLLRYRWWGASWHPIVDYQVSDDGTNWRTVTRLLDSFYNPLNQGATPVYPYFYIPEHPPARYCRFLASGTPGGAYEIRGLLGYEADYQPFELNFNTQNYKWQLYNNGWADVDTTWIVVGEVVSDADGVVAIHPYAIGGRNLVEVQCLESQTYRDYVVSHNLGCIPNLIFCQQRSEGDYRNNSAVRDVQIKDEWGDWCWSREETGVHSDATNWRSWGSEVREVSPRQLKIRSGFAMAAMQRALNTWYRDAWNRVARYRFFVDRGW